jgi:hypothetical protein
MKEAGGARFLFSRYEKTGENFNGCKFSAAAQTTAA